MGLNGFKWVWMGFVGSVRMHGIYTYTYRAMRTIA